jgi:hypothetical protein
LAQKNNFPLQFLRATIVVAKGHISPSENGDFLAKDERKSGEKQSFFQNKQKAIKFSQ